MNTEFKVKLTPKDEKAVYSQSLPMPILLKEDLIVELALMHKYGIITILPFSKHASPIFAQRKSNGKLRLLVDLRKINTLIANDYTNNNHPVSTLSDAAQHLAGKSLFCKLDCSQSYHSLQMADQRSVEMLAFNFASRTFAYKRLAQGLSRSMSAFLFFMRDYLDPVVKANQCAQYLRGWYWNRNQKCYGPYPEHSSSLPAHSQCRIDIDNWKVSFWSQASWNSWKNHFIRGRIATNSQDSKFLEQTEIPQIEKSFAAVSGVRELLQKLHSQNVWKA